MSDNTAFYQIIIMVFLKGSLSEAVRVIEH